MFNTRTVAALAATSAPAATPLPHPKLTPIAGKPNKLSLTQLRKELSANAIVIKSIRGGQYGYYYTLVDVDEWNRTTDNAPPIQPPEHPGVSPNIPEGATQHQILQIHQAYSSALAEWQQYNVATALLQSQIIEAVEDKYIRTLKHNTLGYANVTAKALLDHLLSTYGHMTPFLLKKNEDRLDTKWTEEQDIEDLWTPIEEARNFAAGHEAIATTRLIRAAEAQLRTAGLFSKEIDRFYDEERDEQTWDNFKATINKANNLRLEAMERDQAINPPPNYHSANQAADTSTPGSTTTETLCQTCNNANQNQQTSPGLYYCWTHGLGRNPNHTSKTCTNRAINHQENATVGNMLGGNNTIRRQRGEQPIYVQPQRRVRQQE